MKHETLVPRLLASVVLLGGTVLVENPGQLIAAGPAPQPPQQQTWSQKLTRSVKGLKIKVSPNRRYLVTQDGQPFFYMGDTAWTLFTRLNREEVEEYLKNRAAKGFTVVQAYVFRGLERKNMDGETTLIDRDPAKPNEAFFKNVDYIVNRANEYGLVMAMVVTGGEHVRIDSKSRVFNPTNAFAYGKFLGSRYKDNAVIWLLGGDRAPVDTEAVWEAMAKGLKEGCQGTQLVSYHGPGPRLTAKPTGYSSSFWFHNKDWLDFNMIQSSHRWAVKTYEFTGHDYNLTPVKPVIDMENRYENHPDDFRNTARRMDAHQQREAAYWSMLAGAAGHGSGCNDIWQLYDEHRMPDPNEGWLPTSGAMRGTTYWRVAMDFDGASSMGLMRRLLELRPWYKLVPDQSIIEGGQGEGEDHAQAARAEDGSFILVYLPFGSPISIRMDKISGQTVKAQWYNPRNGFWILIGEYPNTGVVQFTAPVRGDQYDWVLVLEDKDKDFPR